MNSVVYQSSFCKPLIIPELMSRELYNITFNEKRANLIGRYQQTKGSSTLSFIEHEFLQEQKVNGAKVYLIRQVLHDCSGIYAVRILKALVPALRPVSRILINEQILPEPGTVSV